MNFYNLNIINKKDKTMPSVIKVPICATYFEDRDGRIFDYYNLVSSDATNTSVIANSIGVNNQFKIRDFYYYTYATKHSKDSVVKGLEIVDTITIPDYTENGQWLLYLQIDNYDVNASTSDISYYGYIIRFAQKIKKIDRNKFEVHIIIEDVLQNINVDNIYIRRKYLGVKI